MSLEFKKNKCSSLPQRLTENNCHQILSEDGKSILISCTELQDNELNIGVSKKSFTPSQQNLLAIHFIRQPNATFNETSLKIFQQYSTFKNETVARIKTWFKNTRYRFKIGEYPCWAFDRDTKKLRIHPEIRPDGSMRLLQSFPVTDLKWSGNSNKSTPYDVIKKETDQNRNRKINQDSNQENIPWLGEETECTTTIPIKPIIKQEPVDYEDKQSQFLKKYTIPKKPNVASLQDSITASSQPKKENRLPSTANATQPLKISSKCCSQLEDEMESNSKIKFFDGANSQPFPTQKPKLSNCKRKRKYNRKVDDVSPTQMDGLRVKLDERRRQTPAKKSKIGLLEEWNTQEN